MLLSSTYRQRGKTGPTILPVLNMPSFSFLPSHINHILQYSSSNGLWHTSLSTARLGASSRDQWPSTYLSGCIDTAWQTKERVVTRVNWSRTCRTAKCVSIVSYVVDVINPMALLVMYQQQLWLVEKTWVASSWLKAFIRSSNNSVNLATRHVDHHPRTCRT